MGGSYKRQTGETQSCCEVVAECNKKMLQFLQFLFILWFAANGSDGDGEMGKKTCLKSFLILLALCLPLSYLRRRQRRGLRGTEHEKTAKNCGLHLPLVVSSH